MEKKYDLNSYEQNSRERLKYVIDHYCGGSQQRLAEMANVGKASISQYLNGKNSPSYLTAKKIADAVNVHPAWIMGFDVPMRKKQELDAESGEKSTDISVNDEQFREYMRAHYGMLFDLMDGATPEERKQIEGIAKLIIGGDKE